MSITRFGIIGYGEVGKAYAGAIERGADAEVAATAGPCGEGDRYLHFEDAAGVIERNDVDAIIFAGPPAHPAQIVAALSRSRPVLCTGAPGLTMEEATAVREAGAQFLDAPLFFAAPLSCHGSVLRAKAQLEQGSLGEVLTVRCVYGRAGASNGEDARWRNDYSRAGGGVLMDEGYQLIGLLQDLFGPIDDVTGMIARRIPGPHGLEDNAFALLRLRSGAIAQLHASSTQWRQTFRIEIGLEKGYLWLDGLLSDDGGFTPEVLISARLRTDESDAPLPNPAEEVRTFEDDTALDRVLSGFLRVVSGEPVPAYATPEAACDALNTVHRLYAADPAWPRA